MAMTLITTNTASGAANSAFTSSIDSTYKLYIFKCIDINPATNSKNIEVNFSDDTSSHSYDLTKTSTSFMAWHNEDNSDAGLQYNTSMDINQGTGYQNLVDDIGNGSDESCAGTLWLFNPSNTTYVKHFCARFNGYHAGDYTQDNFTGGYINTTAAVTAVDFKFDAGNFDGTIKMYGVG